MYDAVDRAARVYDVAVWRVRRPKTELNFPNTETRADAEFLMPENFRMDEMIKK